jgi:hypothetical protein
MAFAMCQPIELPSDDGVEKERRAFLLAVSHRDGVRGSALFLVMDAIRLR